MSQTFIHLGFSDLLFAAILIIANGILSITLHLRIEKQLLISQDVCFKTSLRRFGGTGYSHFLENIIPNLKTLGLKDSSIKNILINNPQKLFRIR